MRRLFLKPRRHPMLKVVPENFNSMKFRPSLIFLGVVLLGLFPSSAQTIQQTQTFRLDAGWNLIVFQLVPPDPTPAVVFGTLGNSFDRAWAYDNAHKVWSSYARPGIEQSQHNDILYLSQTLEAAFFCGNSNGPPKQRRMWIG